MKKRPVTPENKSTGFKARDTKMTEPIKARWTPHANIKSLSATTDFLTQRLF